MILRKILNAKQLVVGWTMISLISIVIIRTIFALPRNPRVSVRIFLNFYFFIFILGLLIIYALRDKKT